MVVVDDLLCDDAKLGAASEMEECVNESFSIAGGTLKEEVLELLSQSVSLWTNFWCLHWARSHVMYSFIRVAVRKVKLKLFPGGSRKLKWCPPPAAMIDLPP